LAETHYPQKLHLINPQRLSSITGAGLGLMGDQLTQIHVVKMAVQRKRKQQRKQQQRKQQRRRRRRRRRRRQQQYLLLT